jgi:filamentous hemagglutinin
VAEGVRGVSDESPPSEWFASGTIDPRKLDGYALSPTHPVGRHKARLWRSIFGFTHGDGYILEKLLRQQLHQAKPVEMKRTRVRGWELVIPRFRGPNGNEGPVLTAWALEPHKDRPHLTTTYPIVGS